MATAAAAATVDGNSTHPLCASTYYRLPSCVPLLTDCWRRPCRPAILLQPGPRDRRVAFPFGARTHVCLPPPYPVTHRRPTVAPGTSYREIFPRLRNGLRAQIRPPLFVLTLSLPHFLSAGHLCRSSVAKKHQFQIIYNFRDAGHMEKSREAPSVPLAPHSLS